MKSLTQDAHAVNVNWLLTLARILKSVTINQELLPSDSTIRIIGELKNLLKDDERRRNKEIQLIDCEKTIDKKNETKMRTTTQRFKIQSLSKCSRGSPTGTKLSAYQETKV